MGEREYSTVALRELIGRRALDLWQPDLIRLGGVEGGARARAGVSALSRKRWLKSGEGRKAFAGKAAG